MAHVRTSRKSRKAPVGTRSAFARQVGRAPARLAPDGTSFNYPVNRSPAPLDVAAVMHYWHPDRPGIEEPPPDVAERLLELHEDLRLTRPPANAPVPQRCWIVWLKKPLIQHPLCPGWLLLMLWQSPSTGQPLPLDNRLYANLYMASRGKWGSAKKYFDACIDQMKRDKATREKAYQQDRRDHQQDFQQHRKISTAGAGNKFAKHGDGTIIPSRGQLNWHQDTRKRWLPSEVARDEEIRRQQRADFYAGRR